jgi:stage V sporulation protein B
MLLFFGELMEKSNVNSGESSKVKPSGSSKILKGSFIMMIGYAFFRVGGYLYRFLMGLMLGPSGYGILGLTLFFQGVFQILSAGGLPPAIAKFVSQYKAVGEEDMARQVILTSLKYMMVSGILFGLLMFFSAGWIATTIFHKPEATIPFQAISLITPFSVIVGVFRGAFQGVYKMELIVASRAVEQIVMISLAVVFVSIGFYTAGAVLGTGFGFLASSIVSLLLFRKYIWSHFPKPILNFNFMDELKLLKTLILFSLPVIVTALSEMSIYGISTFAIGVYMAANYLDYNAADPIARLPLIISLSVAAAILPAASEASSLKDKGLLETYVTQSYRYVVLLVLPLCVGVALFAQPLISRLFGQVYISGAPVLSVLVIGMTFYSLFMVSSSILQGIGRPRMPMVILIIGTLINIVLNFSIVPLYGITGAAVATTTASFIVMVIVLWQTFRVTKVKLPFLDFAKIGIASIIMGLPLLLLPQTYIGLYAAVIIAPIIFTIVFAIIGGFTKRDVRVLRRYKKKLGPLSGVLEKVVKFIERFAK